MTGRARAGQAQAQRPHTIKMIAELPRGPRSRLTVALDEGPDGSRYVALRAWMLAAGHRWISPRGISVSRNELRAVAWALLQAADELEGTSP